METDDLSPERLPGLFRAWELGRVIEPGADYRIEPAGETTDGAPLIAVFRHPATNAPEVT